MEPKIQKSSALNLSKTSKKEVSRKNVQLRLAKSSRKMNTIRTKRSLEKLNAGKPAKNSKVLILLKSPARCRSS